MSGCILPIIVEARKAEILYRHGLKNPDRLIYLSIRNSAHKSLAGLLIKTALSRHQVEILKKCAFESSLLELMAIADRKDRTKFRHQVLNRLWLEGLLEMSIPEKPQAASKNTV